jgi:hypothetical protein
MKAEQVNKVGPTSDTSGPTFWLHFRLFNHHRLDGAGKVYLSGSYLVSLAGVGLPRLRATERLPV